MGSRRKRLTAAERRAQLIDVGRSVFAERGFEATSVEEIADRAKVSKPVLYDHFGGKQGLYAVIIDREVEQVVSRITEAIVAGTPRERAEKAVLTFLSYVEEHPDGFAVLCHDAPMTTLGRGGVSSMLNTIADRVGEVFTASFKASGYNPKYAPIYAHALVGMVTFVGQWWTDDRRPSVEDVSSHLVALAWMGLRHLPQQPDKLRVEKKPKKSKS